jgi:FKBP-type peptidyl-prolyl cis-trans isomerase
MRSIIIVIVLVFAAAGLTWLLISGFGGDGEGEIITTRSGLKYVDRKIGTGKEAKAGDTVTVHYVGRLEDGKKFDSSLDRNKPLTFDLGRRKVIRGWDEGIAGMREGGIRKLIIPPELAYGEGGDEVIPPNSTLIFEVQLLKVR